MRSIALINQKGGVGKTTTTVNAAAGLARAGARVLLIDLDPQAHATLHLGFELSEGDVSMYDVMVHETGVLGALRDVRERLTLVPASLDLVSAVMELSGREQRETVMRRALAPVQEHYDYLLIDCPPSLDLLTINALAAVNEVMIPLQPHFLALQGLSKLLETVEAVRENLNPGLRVSAVMLCMYETNTRLAQEVRGDVAEFLAAAEPTDAWHGARVLDVQIRRNIKLAECPSYGQTIFDYAPESNGAEDYAALARELQAMDQGERAQAPQTRAADTLTRPNTRSGEPGHAETREVESAASVREA